MSAFFGFFCLAVTFSLLNAEDYNVFSEPKQLNTWSFIDQDQVEKIFGAICENYQIVHENEEIDCANVRFRPKDPLLLDHVIRRRDVDGEEEDGGDFRGSGDGEDGKPVDFDPEPSQDLEDDLVVKDVEEEPKKDADDNIETKDQDENKLEDTAALNETKLEDQQPEEPKEDEVPATTALPVIELFDTAANDTDEKQAPAEEEEENEAPVAEEEEENVAPVPEEEDEEAPATTALPVIQLFDTAVNNTDEKQAPEEEGEEKEAPVGEEEAPVPAIEEEEEKVAPIPEEEQEALVAEEEAPATNTTLPQTESPTTTAASQEPENKIEPSSTPASAEKEPNKTEAPVTTTATEAPNTVVSQALENKTEASGTTETTTKVYSVEVPAESSSQAAAVETTTQALKVEEAPKDPEPINEEQSGNAVLLKAPKDHGEVEGSETDKVLDSIQSKAKETEGQSEKIVLKTAEVSDDKNGTNSEPETAESSTTTNRAGGKDATLLISLFVIVLVIGAAAFAHNYIKKRKQRNQESDNTSNIVKRTPPIVTNGKNDTDIEQGTEMKPLMNNEVVKEYSDKNKEGEA